MTKSKFQMTKMKKVLAMTILIYLPLAYFWPSIFLKNYIFLIIAVLAGLIFFIELKLKEKLIFSIAGGTFGLFLFQILPSPFVWFLEFNLPLPLVIGLGAVGIFLIILIETKLVLFIYEKILGER